ncbi:histidine kinase N-terminal 7TM domain-containing protein [Pseudosulfitobacter sp. DSM 107133]|uniref:sensor histidine kinase n=1 Tax=Pseudosulfitobacter sp. DSM 107133 TaxID=2883100 RepID=UPI0013B37B69|nr:Sensor histidine kinase WalK [Pseudosulfitobacter sp. DSM 107133]
MGATAFVVCCVILWARGNKGLPGHRWFLLTNIGMLGWLVAIAMEVSVPSQACKVLWAELAWPSIVLMPTAWSFFLYEFALSRKVGRAVVIVGVIFHPFYILVAATTNRFHGLLYGAQTRLVVQGDTSFVIYDHGPLYFVAIAFLYAIILASCVIVARAVRAANPAVKGFFKKLFFVTAIPIVFNLSYIIFGVMVFGMDPTPLSFAFSIGLVGWMIIDNRWVDVTAIARDLLYYNSRELIFVVDANGTLLETNHSAKQLMHDQGIAKGALSDIDGMGRVFEILISQKHLPETMEVENGGRYFVPRAYPMSLGRGQRLLGWAVSFVDVTIQKIAADRAINSERLQNQFLATVSHELRTPLTVINGSLQLLTRNRTQTSPEQAERLLELATKNAATLGKLVNDLLETQRLESSDFRLQLDNCDLNGIILDAVDGMETFLPEKNIKILYQKHLERVVIQADADRLQQVIVNVLSNAVKFSNPNSFVEVNLSVEAGMAYVSIKDSGAGIPAGSEEMVFGRFTQVDATDTKKVYGSGLGMHISKQLMLRHGGSIHYVSELGVGTTFTITIPTHQATER